MLIDSNLVGQSAGIFDYFGGLSSFLFGFFIFDKLGGYLTVKNSYLGGFWGGFQDLMTLVGVWFPETDEKTSLMKKTLVRWGLASLALMCYTAGGLLDEAEIIRLVVKRELLSEEEVALVQELGMNPVVPLLWMPQVVRCT
jgi:hypothetical protein